ncbi:hypothetical protein ABIE78_002401 [Sinorhizobium fredii]
MTKAYLYSTGETDLRRGQVLSEPGLERLGVEVELDAGHRFMQRGVDEVQPVLIAALDAAGIGLRVPAVTCILVATRVLGHVPGERRLVGGRRIGAAGFERLIDQVDGFILVDRRLWKCGMDHVFRIDVLQHRDGDRRTGALQRLVIGILPIALQHQADTFPIIGNGEGDLLGAFAGDGHELAGEIDLVGGDVRDTRIRRLVDVLDFVRVPEQRLGNDATHIDVEALQLVLGALEVPRRIRAAGTEDQVAARQNFIELAGRLLRLSGHGGERGDCEARGDGECLDHRRSPLFRSRAVVRYIGHSSLIPD